MPHGGDGGTGNSGGIGDAGGPSVPRVGECLNPTEFSPNLEACDGGFVHRAQALPCTFPPRDPDFGAPGTPVDEGEEVLGDCTWDSDCAGGAYCVWGTHLENFCRVVDHFCYSPCEFDADCAPGNICACKRVRRAATHETISLGFCSPATCSVDSDCSGGAFCSGSLNPTAKDVISQLLPVASFRCQSAADECFGAGHCPKFPSNQDNEDCREPDCEYDGSALACLLTPTCHDDTCEF